ncbi:MAG: hypothetical protein HJJLKODD_00381 [Phycisphaerae bacterium]|nr:hypothetical protein [Phycisphaerae bacterium]
MNISVAGYRDQVAPRLDRAVYLINATVEGQSIIEPNLHVIQGITVAELAKLLSRYQVCKLACGGIKKQEMNHLEDHGIQVLWGIIGPIRQALYLMGRDQLSVNTFITEPHQLKSSTVRHWDRIKHCTGFSGLEMIGLGWIQELKKHKPRIIS